MGRNHSKINRRTILKRSMALSAIGFSPSVVRKAKGDEYIEITTDVGPDGFSNSKFVPREWFEQKEHAKRVKSTIKSQFYSDIQGISITPSGEYISDWSLFEIIAYLDEDSSLVLPDTIEGVPVSTIRRPISTILNCQDSTNTCLPGGTSIMPDHHEFYNQPTLGYTAYDTEAGVGRFVTVAHACEAESDHCPPNDIEGVVITDNSPGDIVGSVESYSWDLDYAILDDSGDYNPHDRLVNESIPVWSGVTENGLDDIIATGKTVHRYGQSTCHTEGTIYDILEFEGPCDEAEFITLDVDQNGESGDSGGPYYVFKTDHMGQEYISIVGLHSGLALINLEWKEYGPAHYKISEKENIVGGHYDC